MAGLLLLALIAIVGSTPLLSAALDCCAVATLESALHGDDVERGSHEQCGSAGSVEGEHCPCPLPCSPGCTGHTLRALVAALAPIELASPRGAPILQRPPEQRPSSPEPGEILHVPRPQHG